MRIMILFSFSFSRSEGVLDILKKLGSGLISIFEFEKTSARKSEREISFLPQNEKDFCSFDVKIDSLY